MQAGQLKLDRTKPFDVFESARVIVPCGIHVCQLVVEEECYPVIDIDIDDSTEIASIILQEGRCAYFIHFMLLLCAMN